MRKALLAFAAIAALAGVARADATPETIGTNEELKDLRLHRYVFDTVGQDADFRSACAGGSARRVEVRRNAGDVTLGILTLGWYTPVHVRVSCGAPVR